MINCGSFYQHDPLKYLKMHAKVRVRVRVRVRPTLTLTLTLVLALTLSRCGWSTF